MKRHITSSVANKFSQELLGSWKKNGAETEQGERVWNKRELDKKNGRLYGALYSKCRKCDHRCNAKQCAACEWAGRYFMNGGGHVIAAPPKADISHWLSTRTQEISPLKQYRFQSPEMGATSTKTAHTRNTRQICGFFWCGRVCVMPFINVVFYEWRLWYVNESDWEKNGILSFLMSTSPRSIPNVFSLKEFGPNANTVCVILIDDYVLKSWRTTPRLKT